MSESDARAWRRLGLGLALAACLAALQGCAVVRKIYIYTSDRVNDGFDMVDFGVTLSGKRGLSVYGCGGGLFTLGAGYVDGYFVGVGGGRIGIFRHYHKAIGLVLWSYEEFGWGDFDVTKPETLNRRYVGLLGWLFFRQPGQCYGPT